MLFKFGEAASHNDEKKEMLHSREIQNILLQAPWTEHVVDISARMLEQSCLEE